MKLIKHEWALKGRSPLWPKGPGPAHVQEDNSYMKGDRFVCLRKIQCFKFFKILGSPHLVEVQK